MSKPCLARASLIGLMLLAGQAVADPPSLKAMPLGRESFLTLSGEVRLRYDDYANRQLMPAKDEQQGLLRGVLGAELRVHPQLRFYGEVGAGQVDRRRNDAAAIFQNDGSLQQLLVDVRRPVGNASVGAMIGRQEFADGPRQLISLSDGPNLHRSWNGVRLYLHEQTFRLGAFDFRATRLKQGAFDEEINHDERLQGVNASFGRASGSGPAMYLEPFWLHSRKPSVVLSGQAGMDDRDTLGLRFWGERGDLKFDWTLAYQTGEFAGQDIDAWGLFASQSVRLTRDGWKPRLTLRVDVASGDGDESGSLKRFNPLYASSNYLGEGQFLSLSNLVMVTPGLALAPTASTALAIEYGFARRFDERDAAYAGGLRAYAGTQHVSGREIGGLLRLSATWSVCTNFTLFTNVEHFDAGAVLTRVQRSSGRYANIGLSYRY